tara:strand:- start:368 stop:2515 length:2148 start_codon:yes stop_codon:yes gene_type:complete
MGIFNEFNKKEKPVFTGITRGIGGFGFGKAAGGGSSGPGWDSTQEASGGFTAVYEDGGSYYKTHTFYTSGAFVTDPGASITAVDYLVVGAGGGGGGGNGSTTHGGGGAGGGGTVGTTAFEPYLHPSMRLGRTMTVAAGTPYGIVIGNGGLGGHPVHPGAAGSGTTGGASSIADPAGTITAYGGGYGGGGASPGSGGQGENRAPFTYAGGGGGGGASPNPGPGGTGSSGAGSGGAGGNGGSSATGAGGGGAGGTGSNGGATAGDGGAGRSIGTSIDGITTFYVGAGGGGGGDDPSTLNPNNGSYWPVISSIYTQVAAINPNNNMGSAGAGGSTVDAGAHGGGGPGGWAPGTPTNNNGTLWSNSGQPGIDGTGGGGGGAHGGYDSAGGGGGPGGPGMVVVRYQIPQAQAIANPGGTFLATGGRTSHSPTRTYHLFTHPGTLTVSSPLSDVEVLVVGAGGGGGFEAGGGGGAGAVVEVTSYTVSNPVAVTVGQGGCSMNTNSPGHNQTSSNTGKGNAGSNSSFGPITALGGQGGGSGFNSIQTPVSPFGGCGGGSHDNVGTNDPAPAQPGQNGGIANLNQYSNPGGPNAGPGINNGNGGGGAGGAAGDTMEGGIGRQVPTNFRPSPSTYLNAGTPGPSPGGGYFAGGGAGGNRSGTGDANTRGGYGGGGRSSGPGNPNQSAAGVVFTGGGGGGTHSPYQYGRKGGSGIVIVSYPHSGS